MKTSQKRREQRKRAKQRKELMQITTNTVHPNAIFGYDNFGPFVGYLATPQKTLPNKKEETMNVAHSAIQVQETETQETKAFKRILERMSISLDKQTLTLLKKHGLIDDDRPETPKQLVERIKTGKYIVHPDSEDRRSYYCMDFFTWRDPKIEKDQEGYDEAKEQLYDRYQAALDRIYISTGEDGLKVYETFAKGK